MLTSAGITIYQPSKPILQIHLYQPTLTLDYQTKIKNSIPGTLSNKNVPENIQN